MKTKKKAPKPIEKRPVAPRDHKPYRDKLPKK